jgi:hypothetical protein
MTTTPELDRALQAASDAIHGQGWSPRSHIYARALVAELLRDAPTDETNPFQARSETQSYRFIAGFAEIKRRAGIVEGEG